MSNVIATGVEIIQDPSKILNILNQCAYYSPQARITGGYPYGAHHAVFFIHQPDSGPGYFRLKLERTSYSAGDVIQESRWTQFWTPGAGTHAFVIALPPLPGGYTHEYFWADLHGHRVRGPRVPPTAAAMSADQLLASMGLQTGVRFGSCSAPWEAGVVSTWYQR